MSEMIKSIEIVEDLKLESEHFKFDGYKVTTSDQEILVVIENNQTCCESWGYCDSLDNLNDFTDAELLEIEIVDSELNSKVHDALKEEYACDDAMFVNFNTSNGKFQIVVYNAHNGYYGHTVKIVSNQLNHSAEL